MISILHLINLNDLVISVIFKKKNKKKQKQTNKQSKNKQSKTKANI